MLSQRSVALFFSKRFIYRRTEDVIRSQVKSTTDILWNTIENSNIKSAQDWKTVRNEILTSSSPRKPITLSNIDAMTVGICTSKKRYDLALSYLDYLEMEKIKPNLATLGKYFRLMYVKSVNSELSQEEQDRILKMYENVRQNHPVLDALTLESIIQAISLTKKWKICVDLLEELKLTAAPGGSSYNAVISAAFLNNEDDLGWRILYEMLDKDKNVFSQVYSSYFTKTAKHYSNKTDVLMQVEKMFNFLQKNCLKLNSDSLEDLVDLLKKIQIDIRSTTVSQRGVCKCCKSTLTTFELSECEFDDLKTKIIQNVIVGKDVFNKSTPNELRKFKDFIANMERFDVVIDGLNVAYSVGVKQSPHVFSALVAAVVSHFVTQGKKVLVLGRSHMNRWPKNDWGYILKNATVFLTEDLSQDDPYLLYCALNSGKDTIIITRDMMRGHKFLLKNNNLKVLFDKWLQQRQYHLIRISESRVPIFKKPSPFSHVAQKNGNCWHIPCTGTSVDRYSLPNNWLCIQC